MARGAEPGAERWLNGATAVLLIVAAGLLVRDRLLPAWRAREVVDVGDEVPGDLSLVSLASRDTLRVARVSPSLLLYFQSTCPACTRNLPAWKRLLEERPAAVRVVAVGLEAARPALSYVRTELPGALATRPADRPRTLRLMGVEAVPTTQLVDGEGRLVWSRSGVLTTGDVDGLLDRARGPASAHRGPTRRPHPRPSNGRAP